MSRPVEVSLKFDMNLARILIETLGPLVEKGALGVEDLSDIVVHMAIRVDDGQATVA